MSSSRACRDAPVADALARAALEEVFGVELLARFLVEPVRRADATVEWTAPQSDITKPG